MKVTITKNRGGAEYNPAPGISRTGDSLDRREICMLLNDVDYFLNRVFIITERIGCRLFVIHSGHVKTNRFYDELRGAKIAFARMYNRKSRRKGVKAEWTHLYKPYSGWLDEKIKMLRKQVSI
ncbi:MAG: hypothetical protein KAT34_10475 [Candidatus Aminicenantes bacterium]|nr:hypothetical protein [Candidatus Aminicenantes bacterium]